MNKFLFRWFFGIMEKVIGVKIIGVGFSIIIFYRILGKLRFFWVLVNVGIGEMIFKEFFIFDVLWCYKRDVIFEWINKYRSVLNSKMCLINEYYENYFMKYIYNKLKGIGFWKEID